MKVNCQLKGKREVSNVIPIPGQLPNKPQGMNGWITLKRVEAIDILVPKMRRGEMFHQCSAV